VYNVMQCVKKLHQTLDRKHEFDVTVCCNVKPHSK